MKRFIILFLLSPFILLSQNNDVLYQNVILSVFDKLDKYETNSSFSNEERTTEYKKLFVSPQSLHTNDIAAMQNYNNLISIEDYVINTRNYYSTLSVDLDVKYFGPIVYENNNKGSISVYLNKEIIGENVIHNIPVNQQLFLIKNKAKEYKGYNKYVKRKSSAIEYDSKENAKNDAKKEETVISFFESSEENISYEDDFLLKIDFVFTINNDSAIAMLINKIDLVETEKKKLVVITTRVSNIFIPIFNKKSKPIYKYDMELQFKEKDSSWTDFSINGYFHSFKNVEKDIKIKSKDPNYYSFPRQNIINNNVDIVTGLREVVFLKTIGSLNISTLINSGQEFLSNSPNFSISSNPNKIEDQIDLALNIRVKKLKTFEVSDKEISLNFNLFVNYSKNIFNHDLLVNSHSYSYASVDSDGASYERTVNLSNINENQIIRVSSYHVSPSLSLNLQKFSFLISHSLPIFKSNFKVLSAKYISSSDAFYSGYYEDLFGITLSENGVYDFGVYEINGSGDIIAPKLFTSNQFNSNLTFTPEFLNQFGFSVGIKYIYFTDPVFQNSDKIISSNFNELNSIMDLSPIDMNQFLITFGLSLKF